MRITDNMRFDTVQRSLSALRSRQATLTQQISSGSKLNGPSDDPVAAARVMRLSAQASRTADYRATIETVRSDLELSEGSLAAASDLMVRAKELALQGANGSLNADDRRMRFDCHTGRPVLRLPEHQRQPEQRRADRLHAVLESDIPKLGLCDAPRRRPAKHDT